MISYFLFHYFSLRSKLTMIVIGTEKMEASFQEAGGEHRHSYLRGVVLSMTEVRRRLLKTLSVSWVDAPALSLPPHPDGEQQL